MNNFGFPGLTDGQPSAWLYVDPITNETFVRPAYAADYTKFRSDSITVYQGVSVVYTMISGVSAVQSIRLSLNAAATAAASTAARQGGPILAGLGAQVPGAAGALAPSANAVGQATAAASPEVMAALASYMSIPASGGATGGGPVGIPNATRLTEAEQATAARLQAQEGVKLRESPHVGADYIDDLGRTYDQIGNPSASQFWNEKSFFQQIDKHLLKSNDFTVIDMTGFTKPQITAVQNYVDSLSQASQAKLIRIGF
jgi:hypothetical protein